MVATEIAFMTLDQLLLVLLVRVYLLLVKTMELFPLYAVLRCLLEYCSKSLGLTLLSCIFYIYIYMGRVSVKFTVCCYTQTPPVLLCSQSGSVLHPYNLIMKPSSLSIAE